MIAVYLLRIKYYLLIRRSYAGYKDYNLIYKSSTKVGNGRINREISLSGVNPRDATTRSNSTSYSYSYTGDCHVNQSYHNKNAIKQLFCRRYPKPPLNPSHQFRGIEI